MNIEAEIWITPITTVKTFINTIELVGSINGKHKLVDNCVYVSLYNMPTTALNNDKDIAENPKILPTK